MNIWSKPFRYNRHIRKYVSGLLRFSSDQTLTTVAECHAVISCAMSWRRIALLILYAVGIATVALTLAPLIGWWSVPLGFALFAIFLKLPYYRDWQ
jgi:hypothetical protein